MTDDRSTRIQGRAYALWEQEGRPEGRHEDHWRQAEQKMGGDGQGAAPGSGDLGPADQPMAQPGSQGTGGMGASAGGLGSGTA